MPKWLTSERLELATLPAIRTRPTAAASLHRRSLLDKPLDLCFNKLRSVFSRPSDANPAARPPSLHSVSHRPSPDGPRSARATGSRRWTSAGPFTASTLRTPRHPPIFPPEAGPPPSLRQRPLP